MTRQTLHLAMKAAEEFIRRGKSHLKESEPDAKLPGKPLVWRSKASSAVRRASLELTRALADMRRSS